MRKWIVAFITLCASIGSICQTPLTPPLPAGTTYYKGRIVSQIGVGIIGCDNTELILADGSGCQTIPAGGSFTAAGDLGGSSSTQTVLGLTHVTNAAIPVAVTAPSVAAGTTVLEGTDQQEIDFRAVGGVCNGVWNGSSYTGTDDTANLNAADAYLQSVGGGTLRFPPANCIISGHIVLPNDNTPIGASTNPYSRQAPIHWHGTGGDARLGEAGGSLTPGKFSGTTLVMTYGGTGATGRILEQSIYAGGSGYTVGDTGTVGGTCSGTTYTVEWVDTGVYAVGNVGGSTLTHTGYADQVYISSNGTGCTVADNVATTATTGSGTGLTLNIAAVQGGDFAKIETYGMGKFEIEGLTMFDPGSDWLPFFRTTGTTYYLHNMEIYGTGNKQDAIVQGGTSNAFTTLNSPLAAFQGYDSHVDYLFFNKIRRATYTQMFSATTYVTDPNVFQECASDIPEGAAFESNPPIIDSVTGATNPGGNGGDNTYVGGRVEMLGYKYAYRFFSSSGNIVAGADLQDVGVNSTVQYGFLNSIASASNTIIPQSVQGLPQIVGDATSVAGTVSISNGSSFPSFFNSGFSDPATTSEYPAYGLANFSNTPATSGSTYKYANGFHWISQAWNGSASVTDVWTMHTQASGELRIDYSGPTASPDFNFAANKVRFGGGLNIDSSGNLTMVSGTNNEMYGTYYFDNGNILFRNTAAATSGANKATPGWTVIGNIWNGSASVNDQYSVGQVLGTGANPTSYFKVTHQAGTTGYTAFQADAYATTSNCSVNSASPGACGSAPSGAFVVPTSTTSYTVNTTAITAKSRIILQPISFAADLPSSPTCVAPSIVTPWTISAITAATSFTVTIPTTTGQTCWYYSIQN